MNPLSHQKGYDIVPTNYGHMPKKKDPLYLKKRESSEIIEFKNELTYWSNRIEEISTHYRSSLLPGQIQELVELQTKIKHVKESITPGRKSYTSPQQTPITSPMRTPITSPPESPRSIAIRKKLPPIPIKKANFKPNPPSERPPVQMTQSAPTLIHSSLRTQKDEFLPPVRSDSIRRSKSKNHYSNTSTATNSSTNSIDAENNYSRRNSRSRSHRNSWDQENGSSIEVKPSSAPKSFYHLERRRSSRKNADPPPPPDESEVQLGLALIKAVKYLDKY